MSAWNDFVKKIYWEGKKKNATYKFKDALKDASRRKSEMGSGSSVSKKSARKMSRSRGLAGGKKSRKRRH
jgi:hypothetical protein